MERRPPMPEEDYEAIEAAVMDTARGRWFLAEFARRNRNADTALLLDAIERIERLMALRPAPATMGLPAPTDPPPALTSAVAEPPAATASLAAPQETVIPQAPAEAAVEPRSVSSAPEPAAVTEPVDALQPVALDEPLTASVPVAAASQAIGNGEQSPVEPQEAPAPGPVTLDAGEPEWFDDIVWVPVPGDRESPELVSDAELIAVEIVPDMIGEPPWNAAAHREVQSTAPEPATALVPAAPDQAGPQDPPAQPAIAQPEPVAEEPANVSFIAPESRLIEAAAPQLVEAEITPLPSGSSPPPVDPLDIDAMSFELKSVYFA